MKYFIIYFMMIFIQMLVSSNRLLSYIDFIFIFVFFVNSQFSYLPAVLFSFFSGLYADFYYSFPIGLHSLIYVLMSYVFYLFREKIEFNFIFSRFLNFIIVSFSVNFLTYSISYFAGWKISFGWMNIFFVLFNFIFYEIVRLFLLRFLKGQRYGVL